MNSPPGDCDRTPRYLHLSLARPRAKADLRPSARRDQRPGEPSRPEPGQRLGNHAQAFPRQTAAPAFPARMDSPLGASYFQIDAVSPTEPTVFRSEGTSARPRRSVRPDDRSPRRRGELSPSFPPTRPFPNSAPPESGDPTPVRRAEPAGRQPWGEHPSWVSSSASCR